MASPTAFSGQSPLPAPGALSSVFKPTDSGQTHYRTSRARTTMFSFIFLILLPFFVSLPAMIVMRIMSGRWDSTLGLAILAVGFAAIMFLVVVELMFSIRARIDLGDTAVKMTLPAGRGLMPMLRYQRHEIPYSDIKAIESRREIYGGTLAPVLMRGARIVTKGDRSIQLGYLNEANVDPAFPYSEIAEQIAARAGLQVIDRGAVRRNVANKVMGIRTMDDGGGSIDDATVADLNRRHAHVIIVLVAGLMLLVGVGIAGDLLTQPDSVAGPPKASAPQKATPPQKK
ncbi:MAG: hypothetical protein ABL908_16040 [Hyphomicrobium sp.]